MSDPWEVDRRGDSTQWSSVPAQQLTDCYPRVTQRRVLTPPHTESHDSITRRKRRDGLVLLGAWCESGGTVEEVWPTATPCDSAPGAHLHPAYPAESHTEH